MSAFTCFSPKKAKEATALSSTARAEQHQQQQLMRDPSRENAKERNFTLFTFEELATATSKFSSDNYLGQGGFGRVYKGTMPQSGQIVAVKQLNSHGSQGNKEFLAEIRTLSILNHRNLVHLIGFCPDGIERLLVYEYMPLGSLDKNLFGPTDQEQLSWKRRMKIALDVAMGLEYLHEMAKPPIIYRNLKSSNILLDDHYNAKLSDFRLAKHAEDKAAAASRVMGTDYTAPEYRIHGSLSPKIDVYSYGVLMLELITGRRAIDDSRPEKEQALVTWVGQMLKDKRRYKELADPCLGEQCPEECLKQAVIIAVMCLQDNPELRPLMTDVVLALNHLAASDEDHTGTSKQEKPLLIEECRSEEPISDDVRVEGVAEHYDVKAQHLVGDSSTENAKQGNLTLFTYQELGTATNNFDHRNLLGKGGFGEVFKGTIPDSGQIVAVKKNKLEGSQGEKEFRAEIAVLSNANHPNLVQLVGYCLHGLERLLVYEYMPLGTLEKNLIGMPPEQEPLSWMQRIKIALDVALGLEYLHGKVEPPIIYRDLKSSNILIDEQYNGKLSDFGLAMPGTEGYASKLAGTFGYFAPEYAKFGLVSPAMDVYAFGVIILELITGRRAMDTTKPYEERNLAHWAAPMLKDQRRYRELVDPRLGEQCSGKSLNLAVAIAEECLRDEQESRPRMSEVAAALNRLIHPNEGTGVSKQEKPLLIGERRSEEPIHDDVKVKAVVAQSDIKGKGKAVDG